MSDSLQPHGLQHARLPCPSLCPEVCSDSCSLSWWCHPTISSSVTALLLNPSASGSFPMSQLFESGGQRIGALASASVLPINIQDWFPLGLTGRGETEKEAKHTESCRMTLQPWISHRHSGLQQTLILRGRGGLGRTGWLGAGPGGADGHSVNMGVGLDIQNCSPD